MEMEHIDFASTVAGRKALQEIAAARTAERQKKLDTLTALREKQLRERPVLERELNEALTRRKAAEDALAKAEDAVRDRQARLWDLSTGITATTNAITADLRRTIPAATKEMLENFRCEMDDLHIATRRIKQSVDNRPTGEWFRVSGRQVTEPWGNQRSIERKLAVINEIRRYAMDELELAADVSPDAIAAVLDELRRRIPRTVEMERLSDPAQQDVG